MRFRSVCSELQELRCLSQEQKPKGKEQEEAKQRDEYLEFEVGLQAEEIFSPFKAQKGTSEQDYKLLQYTGKNKLDRVCSSVLNVDVQYDQTVNRSPGISTG